MANGTPKGANTVKWTTTTVAIAGIAFTTFTFYDGRRDAALSEVRSDFSEQIGEVVSDLRSDVAELERDQEREMDQLIRRIERLESLLMDDG